MTAVDEPERNDARASASGAVGTPRGRRSDAMAELVLEIVAAAGGESELEQILAATLARLRDVVPLTGGAIALVEGDDLVIRAAVGPFAESAMGQRQRRGPSRSWNVVLTGSPFLSPDLRAEGIVVHAGAPEGGIRSWLGVPIARGGTGIGLLEIDSTQPSAFDERDTELLVTVARALAGPVDLAMRYAAEQRARRLRDAFVGVISHELRTPITTIYGASMILRDRFETLAPEVRNQALEDIEAEADRLRRLVEDLLVLSRAEGGRVELSHDPLLVSHLVRHVAEAESARWPAHRFNLEVPRVLPLVIGEETYLEQIVRNLLTNAAKYSPAGSEIRLVAEATSEEVIVRVIDEGIGLSQDDPDRLFDLFYRAPGAARRAPGAGIGLFVCRQLVEAMSGRIWATSRPEHGSEFGFALPIAELGAEGEPG